MTSPAFPNLTRHFAHFPIDIEEKWEPIDTPIETGHHNTRPRYTRPLRQITWRALIIQWADLEKVLGFLRHRRGAYFYIDNTEKVVSPYDAPTLSQAAGGNLGARTLYVVYTWGDGTLQTLYSQEATLSVDANKLLSVAPDWLPAGVTQYNIFIGTSSGAEKYVSKLTTDGGTWSELETFVDGDSASGQKILNVDSSTGFQAGDTLILNTGGAREEICTIDTTGAGTITMVANLTYTHTQAQADKVNHNYTGGAALPTTNTQTEEVKVTLAIEPKYSRNKALTYSMTLVFLEAF